MTPNEILTPEPGSTPLMEVLDAATVYIQEASKALLCLPPDTLTQKERTALDTAFGELNTALHRVALHDDKVLKAEERLAALELRLTSGHVDTEYHAWLLSLSPLDRKALETMAPRHAAMMGWQVSRYVLKDFEFVQNTKKARLAELKQVLEVETAKWLQVRPDVAQMKFEIETLEKQLKP